MNRQTVSENHMQTRFSLRRRTSYPWWFGFVAIFVLVGFYFLPDNIQSPQLLLSTIGGVAAFFHFLYSQHNNNTDRFINLFRDFNARYDDLNDQLNVITTSQNGPLIEGERLQTLYDYFNLCAEEYLYYKGGYIDEDVWEAWLKGMRYFASNTEIRRIWQRELERGSYYGFSLKLLDAAA